MRATIRDLKGLEIETSHALLEDVRLHSGDERRPGHNSQASALTSPEDDRIHPRDDLRPGHDCQTSALTSPGTSPASNIDAIAGVLQTHGLPALNAVRVATLIANEILPHAAFIELYGRTHLVTTADDVTQLHVHGTRAFDMRTCRPDGLYLDFNRREDRRWARTRTREGVGRLGDWLSSVPRIQRP